MAPAAAVPAHNPTLAPVSGLAHASPSVRKFARELGVPLTTEVQGSGRKGRITQEDVQAFTQSVMAGAVETERGYIEAALRLANGNVQPGGAPARH